MTDNDFFGWDKAMHAFVCFIISAVLGSLIAHIPPHSPWLTASIAMVLTMIVGVWREVQGRRSGGHFCRWDLLADFLGALLGCAVAWLAAYCLRLDQL